VACQHSTKNNRCATFLALSVNTTQADGASRAMLARGQRTEMRPHVAHAATPFEYSPFHCRIFQAIGAVEGVVQASNRLSMLFHQVSRIELGVKQLKDEFLQFAGQNNRKAAGLALERLLNRLFELFGLQPGQSFRVVGQQMDGSFQMNAKVYLRVAPLRLDPFLTANIPTSMHVTIGMFFRLPESRTQFSIPAYRISRHLWRSLLISV
jgi:hypothetical protein